MALGSQGELREALYGLLGGHSTASKALIDTLSAVQYKVDKPADAATSTTSTYTLDYSTGPRFRVDAVKYVPGASLTADNTNLATLELVYNNGNGGSDTVIATVNTAATAGGGTGNWTADIGVAVTVTAANSVVPAGSQIQLNIAKSGAAVIVPAGTLIVKGTRV
jgi:hypothetical protein